MKAGKILIVDDEPAEREGLARLVGQWGYDVETASSAEEAMNLVETQHPAVVLTDLVLPEMDGLTLLQRLKETGRPPIVLMVTGHGTVETAVEAMRHGAFDYLTKAVDTTRLQVLLEKSIEQESLSREVSFLRHQLRQKGSFGQMVGQSRGMQEVYRWVELAGTSTAPVLVYGESGTGKELVARTIHELSNRRTKPFVAINCAAIPETLIESELFGHEKGAFTGAVERRAGCFELAQNGTLLLDELGEMPVGTQAKLLRVLEDSCVRRLGGKTEIAVDVRVIASTNKVLEDALRKGELREDLFYRLNVFQIFLPPLREREGDLPLLTETLIEMLNRKHETRVVDVQRDVVEQFRQYSWPGNVRELRNVLERAVILVGEGTITQHHLPRDFGVAAGSRPTQQVLEPDAVRLPVGTTVSEAEKSLIQLTLQHTKNNKTRAAEILGISLKTLFNKLKEYGAAEAEAGTG